MQQGASSVFMMAHAGNGCDSGGISCADPWVCRGLMNAAKLIPLFPLTCYFNCCGACVSVCVGVGRGLGVVKSESDHV